MNRRPARTARITFCTAQLALWDELESLQPKPPAHAEARAESAEHAPAQRPGSPAPEALGGAR